LEGWKGKLEVIRLLSFLKGFIGRLLCQLIGTKISQT
jgi:hypothetical protein